MTQQDQVMALHASQLRDAWADWLATEPGRLAMHHILGTCGVYEGTFTGDQRGAYLEGRRSIGLELQNVYLAAQGARTHGLMLIEAEDRMNEIMAAVAADQGDADADE